MRSEYREPSAFSWSVSVVLLVANVACFLAELMIVGESASRKDMVNKVLALSLDGLKHGYVWQLVTYQFMHGGLLHLLFNCLLLYFVGRQIEALLDRSTFLLVYFGGGVAGGLLQVMAGLIPGYESGGVVGASGSLMALLGAFCWLFWRQPIRMLVMFVLPLTLSGRAIFVGLVVIDLVGLTAREGNLAHFAHLGGLLAGFFYIRSGRRIRIAWPPAFYRFLRTGSAGRRSPGTNPSRYEFERSASPGAQSKGDFMASEVDPILDKISAHGIHSLTAEERAILEQAQKRMARR